MDISFRLWIGSQRFPHLEFCHKIVQNSPKLEKISATPMNMQPLFQSLVNLLRETQVGNRLTSLYLDNEGNLTNSQYDQLAEIGLKLKKFLAILKGNNVVGLSNFLKNQSESLEKLEVNLGFAQCEFERMPRLKSLKIYNNGGNGGTRYLWNLNQPISYKKLFPALEHLELSELNNKRKLDIFLHSGRNEEDIGQSVRKLSLDFDIRRNLSPENIENAAYLFPNLTELGIISANLKILKTIYSNMRKLQDLSLEYSSEDNRDLGIDNLLMGIKSRRADCYCDVYFNPDESLLALKELQKLRLYVHEKDIIGDKVCRRVLMKMKALKLIKIYGFDEDEGLSLNDLGMSNVLLEEMRKKMVVICEYSNEDEIM